MKVIFHGDDFGLTPGVNQGIIHAYQEGLLTSTSLMASGEAVQEAISLAGDHPSLDTGVHLTLCDERPVLKPERLSSIIPKGDRLPSMACVLKQIITGRMDYREVEAEWRAQVETALDGGIPVSHLDSHQFVHLFPGLLTVYFKIARSYRIPFVRGSVHDPISLKIELRRLLEWTGLALWTRLFFAFRSLPLQVRIVPSVGFITAGGRLKRDALLKILSTIQSGEAPHLPVEVILHPGIGDGYTSRKYRHWRYDWKRDLDLLTDPALKQALAARGILTTSFHAEQ